MKSSHSKCNRTSFLVLLALSHNDMHGYEVCKFIDERSKGFFRLPFGSLYPILHRLEKEKMISAKWENKSSHKPRKVYTLTAKGKKGLEKDVVDFRAYNRALTALLPGDV